MKAVDYIIVGCGLAGIAFSEQLNSNNKTYHVIDDGSQQASKVAAGLYNPIILKRFTEVWKAKEQLSLAMPFYQQLEEKLNVKLDYKIPVYRRFASIEEQNEWFTASDKPHLEPYLSTKLIRNENPSIIAPLGFGEILQTGRIDTSLLLDRYKDNLRQNDQYLNESFKHELLFISSNSLKYKNIKAKYIVFAEGFGMIKNPFFKALPLNVAKGELLTIKAQQLKIDYVLKSSIFVIPHDNDLYSVGATYNWKDTSHQITERAREELINQLKQLITCEFEVTGQIAGIRPTVKDRRPLVGVHSNYKNVAILNGLGTRGVMIAPYVAKQLFEHLEKGKPLDKEIDIQRFVK